MICYATALQRGEVRRHTRVWPIHASLSRKRRKEGDAFISWPPGLPPPPPSPSVAWRGKGGRHKSAVRQFAVGDMTCADLHLLTQLCGTGPCACGGRLLLGVAQGQLATLALSQLRHEALLLMDLAHVLGQGTKHRRVQRGRRGRRRCSRYSGRSGGSWGSGWGSGLWRHGGRRDRRWDSDR